MGEKPTKDLVKEMMDVDILIAVSSPILSLSMFLKPQSGVLEILPRNEKTAMYSRLAYSLDLVYYSHHQLERSVFEQPDQEDPNVAYVDPITLWQYLPDLCNMVRHNKYHI